MEFIVKLNKIFSLLSFVLLLSVANNLFSMEKKQVSSNEEFTRLEEINFEPGECTEISSREIIRVGRGYKKIIFYDIKNNKKICSYEHKGNVYNVCLSQDENYVASGSQEGEVVVFDVKNNKKICSYMHTDGIKSICLSQHGSYVASGSGGFKGAQKKVIVFDIINKKQICSYKHTGDVAFVCLSQDENYVASGSFGEVIVFDIKNNKKRCSYEHNAWVECVYFFQDGNYVASWSQPHANKKGEVIVYDIKNNKKICSYESKDWITGVYFSRDLERFISTEVYANYSIGQVIIHRVSPEFYLDQKRYEAEKKLEKFEKPDEQERIKFIKDELENSDENSDNENQDSSFSIKFIDGTEVNGSKCFLYS